jgi:hypothetical protein
MLNDLKVIFQGFVTNNQDPLMLGRVRAVPIDQTESALLPQDWNPEKDIWTQRDPLIYLPLLPYYISQVPKVDEYIHIFYYNTSQTVDNTKFYIQGPISRPQNNNFENWHNSESLLASGPFLKQANNIKDPLSFVIKGEAKGIYPEPGDNSLLGRGTADIIVKEDEVLIRAGKNITTQTAGFNLPTPKQNRSFVQLSSFTQEKKELEPIKKTVFERKSLLVKKLVEWEITSQNYVSGPSPNGTTGTTFYNGNVRLFSLLPKDQTKTSVINMNTPLDSLKGSVEYSLFFTGKTKEEGIAIINQFITGVNKGKITINGYRQFPFESDSKIQSQFPFYFRPTKNNVDKLVSTGSTDFNMVNDFFRKIKLLPSDQQFGSVLVWKQNVIGEQLTRKEISERQTVYNKKPVTYGTMAGDFLYLLSHKTDIPAKAKINLLPKETLYGITQEYFTGEIKPNTDPMVRGDELMKLLKKIVDFLGSHVHNINEAPIPIGVDGTQLEEIRTILQDANNTILNQNIRIN